MENKIWYAVEYAGFWNIQDTNFYESTSILSANHVGEKQAEQNAKLCASAPEWKELAKNMFLWLEMYAGCYPIEEDHPIWKMLEDYKKLEKMEGDS